ncbi:MAG: D-alanyl-D-alanine carboxypeptidase [Clostridia bacterium]|nr:D-alanyl-D-alanine carboxypeptidase [Clostridia bacterium]
MKKTLLVIILSIALFVSAFSVGASAYQISGFEVTAKGVLLASLDTGDVLFSRNTDKKMYPASLTKIMTALLVIEKSADLNTEIITVSENAVKSILGTGASSGGLKEGEQITALQAVYYLMLPSANDCAVAVAEHFGGDVSGFVNIMNARAEELGMKNTHFANPHGLHDDEHYTTVQDMYLLTKHALSKEVFKEAVSQKRYQMPATNKSPAKTLVTTIYMQDLYSGAPQSLYYRYAKGVKTGFTDAAGRCLISTATKNGHSYICVIMNCPQETNTRNYNEFKETKQLYEWAFNNFEYKTVVDTDTPVAEAKVALCWDHDYVTMKIEGGLSAVLPKDADSSTVQIKPNPDKEVFDAPIKKGEKLGTADIVYAGETLGTVNLVAADSRDANWVLLITRTIKNAFTSTAFKIILLIFVLALVGFIAAVALMNRGRKKRRRRRGSHTRYR